MITDDEILGVLAATIQSGNGVRVPVSGRSMGPRFISVTDILVVPASANLLRPGALIVFQRDGRWAVHRVMRRIAGPDGESYLTKGDGLVQPDQPPVRPEEIKGVVVELGFENLRRVSLLSPWARLKARCIVVRWFVLGRHLKALIASL